jgi:hypothetical protein
MHSTYVTFVEPSQNLAYFIEYDQLHAQNKFSMNLYEQEIDQDPDEDGDEVVFKDYYYDTLYTVMELAYAETGESFLMAFRQDNTDYMIYYFGNEVKTWDVSEG